MHILPLLVWVLAFVACTHRVDSRDLPTSRIPSDELVLWTHVDSNEAAYVVSRTKAGSYLARSYVLEDGLTDSWAPIAEATLRIPIQSSFLVGHGAWEDHPVPYLIAYGQLQASDPVQVVALEGVSLKTVGEWTLRNDGEVSVNRDQLQLRNVDALGDRRLFMFTFGVGLRRNDSLTP